MRHTWEPNPGGVGQRCPRCWMVRRYLHLVGGTPRVVYTDAEGMRVDDPPRVPPCVAR